MSKITVGSSDYEGLIEETGLYPVELTAYKFNTLTGPNVQGDGKVIEFTFRVGDLEDADGEAKTEEVRGTTSQKYSAGTKLMKQFMPALLGRDPEVGEDIDLDDFIGWKGEGDVQFKKSGWPSIEGLVRRRTVKGKMAKAAPVEEEAEEAPAPKPRQRAAAAEAEEAPAPRRQRVREAVADDEDLPF